MGHTTFLPRTTSSTQARARRPSSSRPLPRCSLGWRRATWPYSTAECCTAAARTPASTAAGCCSTSPSRPAIPGCSTLTRAGEPAASVAKTGSRSRCVLFFPRWQRGTGLWTKQGISKKLAENQTRWKGKREREAHPIPSRPVAWCSGIADLFACFSMLVLECIILYISFTFRFVLIKENLNSTVSQEKDLHLVATILFFLLLST